MIGGALLSLLLLGGCEGNSTQDSRTQHPADSSQRVESFIAPTLFNNDWQFMLSSDNLDWSTVKAADQWQSVQLPHTPRLEPRIVNDQWQGFAWYRKKITPRPEWHDKLVFIDFEAAMNLAEVWLDDKKLGEHWGGYLPFSVQLPLQSGEQWLYVKLDNRDNPITGPKPLAQLDFNTYGGIYRNVWLRAENATHITDAVAAGKTASGGIFVTYPKVTAEEVTIKIQTHLAHRTDAAAITLTQNLYFDQQQVASTTEQLTPAETTASEVVQSLQVTTPNLWSPAAPHLYKLETLVFEKDTLVDRQETLIGLREFRIVDQRLYINGQETFLRGVNRHQEYPYVGYAMSDAAQYRDAEKIKAAGFDYVRLSHYPHANAFMQAANELGLVVLDAILGWQYVNEAPEFTAQVLQTCRDLIRRDRNHPSVLAWECSLNESWMEESLIDQFTQIVREELPDGTAYSAGWQEYGYDIYLQARQHRIEHYTPPVKPYIVSEYGDWEYYAMNAGLQQDAWADLLQADRSSRQLLSDGEVRLQQQARNLVEAHNDNFNTPAFADGYWVMFDYNRGYADDLEASGIMSLERLPKFSYYFFQSQRDADHFAGPLAGGHMVYLATHWQADSPLTVPIFTNAERVEIYLNGKLMGEAKPDAEANKLRHPPHTFTLPQFEAGELKAVAWANGKVVAEHQVVTPGPASRLQLAIDRSSLPPQAGRNDTILVRASLQDAAGNNSRVNGAAIGFGIEGDARLLSPERIVTEDGIASALIQVGETLSGIQVTARYLAAEDNNNIRPVTISLVE